MGLLDKLTGKNTVVESSIVEETTLEKMVNAEFAEEPETVNEPEITEEPMETADSINAVETESTEVAIADEIQDEAVLDSEEDIPVDVPAQKEGVPLLRQENGTYIMERDNEILTWNENLLTYQKRNKVTEFALDGTIVIEFVNESSLIGGKEIIIWDKNRGLFGKNTQDNLKMCNIDYKKAVTIGYSKKETDIYHDIYQKLISTLGNKVNAFCWTQEIEPLLFDEANNMIQDQDNRFYRFEDIKDVEILEDGETIMGGSVGQALIGGIVLGQASNVAGTVTKKNTSSTVNNLAIKISLNGLEGSHYTYTFLKKSCSKTDKDYRLAIGTAQQLYASLLTIMPR